MNMFDAAKGSVEAREEEERNNLTSEETLNK
jgi:hypothetical protein